MKIDFHPMTRAECECINGWRWPDVVFDRPALPSERDAYTARDESNTIVGYCTFGAIAELDPQRYVVVSAGLRPQLIGGGNGALFMASVLELARREFPTRVAAGVVKHSNSRSLRSVVAGGFVVYGEADDGEAVIVVDGASVAQP